MMSKWYGWRDNDLDGVARTLETTLVIEFEPRESLYRGDYWSWPIFEERAGRQGHLMLQRNFFDEIDQELAYPQYPDHGVLLLAENLPDGWAERIEAVEGAEVLEET